MKPIISILRFVKRFKFVFIAVVVIAILVGAYFPAHIFYKDHYPPINLVKAGNIGLRSSGSKSTEYFKAPDNWQIVLSYSCTGSISNDVFLVGVTNTNGSVGFTLSSRNTNNGFLTKSDIGNGSSTVPNKGVYSLTVLTDPNCYWSIILSPSVSNDASANYSKDSKYIVQPNSKAIENMIL